MSMNIFKLFKSKNNLQSDRCDLQDICLHRDYEGDLVMEMFITNRRAFLTYKEDSQNPGNWEPVSWGISSLPISKADGCGKITKSEEITKFFKRLLKG